MKTYEATGKTYEEALESGLSAMGVTISDVDITVLEEGSKGLFGLFGSRPYKIKLTLKAVEDDPLADLFRKPEPRKAPKPEKKAEPKPAAPKAEKKPEAPKAEAKPEVTAEPAEEKTETRPAPVQRKAKAPKAPKAEEKPAEVAEEAVEAVETVDAESAEGEATEVKKSRSRSRNRRRSKKNHAEGAVEAAETAEVKEERKPLPPKEVREPIVKPVVTMIPAEEIDPESAAGKAKAFLAELTPLMGVDVQIEVGTDEEGNVFVQMTGDTLGILIGRRGETLDAVQYLTSLRVNRGQEGYTRVTIDTENYRAKREDTLVRLANRMANRAVKTGRKVALEPMNPYERRVIHSALQANEAVDTHSEGEEPRRHVVITLRK